MVFNSLTFLVFLGCVLSLYYRLRHRGQNWMLLAASYVFYGWWDYRFLGLLVFTTLFDYCCALWIDSEHRLARRRFLLGSSIVVNLGVLSVFKYYNFFATSLETAFGSMGIMLSFPMLHVVLPLGISFYTFLSMSYTIDVYRKELKAAHNPLDFMLYVAFFPHLVAGPIVRASYLLPQCQKKRTIVPTEVANGLWLILMGFVKKVVIADWLAQAANWGFSGQTPRFVDGNSWLAIYAFAFQIYGDFSGYSDIARGVSKLMGFELVVNFRAPYLVTNAASFWRHWHISLSTWLRDYLYIPLGGNRKGPVRTYCNLLITMFLGGLWHGAGTAYILWGLYHGTLLAIQRGWKDLAGWIFPSFSPLRPQAAGVSEFAKLETSHENIFHLAKSQAKLSSEPALTGETSVRSGFPFVSRRNFPSLGWLARPLAILVFFHLTCIGWLFFRAGALPTSVNQLQFVRDYIRTLCVLPRHADPMAAGIVILGCLCLFFQWKHETMDRFSQWSVLWQATGVVLALTGIATLGVFEGSQFIYFQF